MCDKLNVLLFNAIIQLELDHGVFDFLFWMVVYSVLSLQW